MSTVIGFDFGTARIGVAVGDTEIAMAQPLTTISGEANEARFAAISRLFDEWQPARLVVGLRGNHPETDLADLARDTDPVAVFQAAADHRAEDGIEAGLELAGQRSDVLRDIIDADHRRACKQAENGKV